MTDTPTVEQRHRDAAAELIKASPLVDNPDIIKHGGADDSGFVQAFRRFEASLTQQPRPDTSVDGLAGELAALDCEEACLKGTPMIPIHRDTLKRILAALTTREAVVEECEHDWVYAGTDYHGSHKGEDAYKCSKCKRQEYRP